MIGINHTLYMTLWNKDNPKAGDAVLYLLSSLEAGRAECSEDPQVLVAFERIIEYTAAMYELLTGHEPEPIDPTPFEIGAD